MKKSSLANLKKNLWIVALDILMVNLAFILALLLRYYVHSQFKAAALVFANVYLRFAPFYTLICLVVFFVCGLYDIMWQYAGFSDFNRVLLANVIAAVLNFLGTKAFFIVMPKSYYLLGGFLQLLLVALVRFSYRFISANQRRRVKLQSWSIPALVVGAGDCAREFIQYLEDKTPFQAVAVAGESGGKTLDGLPVVSYGAIPAQIQYNDIKAVFIADDRLSQQEKDEIKRSIEGIEVRDYIEYLSNLAMSMPLSALLNVVDGPVSVTIDGVEKQFDNQTECLSALDGHREVKCVRGARIELKGKPKSD